MKFEIQISETFGTKILNVHMLVYIKSNIKQVKRSGLHLEDEQEKLMEDEQQHLPLEEAIDDGYE